MKATGPNTSIVWQDSSDTAACARAFVRKPRCAIEGKLKPLVAARWGRQHGLLLPHGARSA